MFCKIFLFLIGICLFSSEASSQCALWSFFTDLTATSGNCLSGSNLGSYEVTGTLSTLYFPTSSGTLTISSDNGTSVTFNAPFSSPVNYTLPSRPGHGTSQTVTVSFSASSCTKQKTHTTPVCCTVTPANTTPSVCEGKVLTLNATGTSGGNYFWSGPGGFSSTQQNPVIANMTATKAGTYQVYLVNGSCTTTAHNVNVTVTPKPVPKTIVPQ